MKTAHESWEAENARIVQAGKKKRGEQEKAMLDKLNPIISSVAKASRGK
jgi:hypothetical protein